MAMKYNLVLTQEMCAWVEENGLIDYGGATFSSFLQHFHIDDMTFYRWKRRAEFAEAIKEAKERFKQRLEMKLVESVAKAAEGFTKETTRTEFTLDKNGKPHASKKIVEEKYYAPNVTANIFLLKNLNPDRWKDRQTNELTGKDGEALSFAPITIEITEATPIDNDTEQTD